MQQKKIKDLLDAKGQRSIITASPDDTVFDAVTRMVENNVGAILITVDDQIRGIMSERDYLRFITIQGRTARDTPVSELMTKKVIYVTPDTVLPEVMAIMTRERIRHVPVLEGQKLLGIVSIGDVVKQISQNQTEQIQVLVEYINDLYPGPSRESTQG
jgi:CBS domain-containing protein